MEQNKDSNLLEAVVLLLYAQTLLDEAYLEHQKHKKLGPTHRKIVKDIKTK